MLFLVRVPHACVYRSAEVPQANGRAPSIHPTISERLFVM